MKKTFGKYQHLINNNSLVKTTWQVKTTNGRILFEGNEADAVLFKKNNSKVPTYLNAVAKKIHL